MSGQQIVLEELERALETIRPRLRGHAGDMTAEIAAPGVVAVTFEGACETCPAMAVTYAGLVRTELLAVAGVQTVKASQVHASGRSLNRIAKALGGRVVDVESPAPEAQRS
ncbi:NifU family protein [Aeromicrobium sp.]|uniref:NifU family protein n=1 Tax=Aeromicrobium sp. TaxID=1871063 RepID=UPI0030BE3389